MSVHCPCGAATMRQHAEYGRFTVRRHTVRPRRGAALVTVLIVSVVAMTMALASSMLVMGSSLTQRASERAALVDDAAISGLEEARDRLNAGRDSVPVSGVRTLEDAVTVTGSNITRWTWVARIGNADSLSNAGEFGVQAEIVTRARDASGVEAIRRALVYQQSFARYAYFTDVGTSASGGPLFFANGWTVSGPLHSNDWLHVASGTPPQAIFKDVVTTARGVNNPGSAQWDKGPAQIVAPIPMPGTADLNLLRGIAQRAGYLFTPSVVTGDSALATMRIEFVAIDADGNGDVTGPDDGYFRVYQQTSDTDPTRRKNYTWGYAMGRVPDLATTTDDALFTFNCGVVNNAGFAPTAFGEESNNNARVSAFENANSRCFLGGDPRLSSTGVFQATDEVGRWLPRTAGSVPASVAARPDGAFLWPLSPALNPSFRGVLFVDGRVGVSGTVRGRVTVASRNNMVVLTDLIQATNPATTSGSCTPEDDMVGLISGENVLWADNALSTPLKRVGRATRKDFTPSPSRPDLPVHAVVLALRSIATERPSPVDGEFINRGTVRQVGGRIQQRAGQGGTFNSAGQLHGYVSDISFNRCALTSPPPYFPTTRRWTLSQVYEIDPQGFSANDWFTRR